MKAGKVVNLEKSFPRGAPEREFLHRANFIVIEHEQGVHTLYSHLDAYGFKVRLGERVHQGQIIAKMGCSGYCQAEHLHIEGFIRAGTLRRSFPIAIVNRDGETQRYFRSGEELFSKCEN